MTSIPITGMTVDEARACVDRIKAGAEEIRARLTELYEREGWRVLGYATWQDCIRDEFAMHRSRAYQLINAYTVDRILTAGDLSTNVDRSPIPEAHARELAPLLKDPETLRAVHADVNEATNGVPTANDYRDAVDRRLQLERPTADVPEVVGPDKAGLPENTFHPDEPANDEPSIAPFVMPEMERETAEERAYYTLSRQRLMTQYAAAVVAATPPNPAADLPSWEAFERWFAEFMAALRDRAARPVRLAK